LTLQVQAILLRLLEDAGSPHFGLDMARAAEMPLGSIYPILARLERAGWIKSAVEDIDPEVEGRRPRRYYTLTTEGQRVAVREIASTLQEEMSRKPDMSGWLRKPGALLA
jgi:DNA-binding PadR family transcriptional regulator